MSPQGGQDPGQIAQWIATGEPSSAAVLRALADVLVAVADHEAGAGLDPRTDARGSGMNDRRSERNRARFAPPALPADASTDDISLWLADTRTRAHQLIDESVTAAQEVINQRAAAIDGGDSTAQAQRHAQRLAIERLRRAVADLTLEVRGVHGRLDRMEGLLRQIAGLPASMRDTTEVTDALAEAVASARATGVAIDEIEASALATIPAVDALSASPELSTLDAPTAELADSAPVAESAPQLAPISDARAAVEAAVASALHEARRAASETAASRLEQTQPSTSTRAPVPTPPAAPERPLSWSPRPGLTPVNATPTPEAPEAPRARLGVPETPDATEATEAAGNAAPSEIGTREATPATAEPPSMRPGLWVPPSAVAPPRAVPPVPAPVMAPPAAEVPAPLAVAPAPLVPAPVVPAPAMAMAAATAATTARPALAPQPQPASIATETGIFYPDGGPVILRIAPISGFQGLMRVQDSVVQLPAVREATVEAYARGEARLRLQLVAALESGALSESLAASLGTRADLQSVSDEERSIQISLG